MIKSLSKILYINDQSHLLPYLSLTTKQRKEETNRFTGQSLLTLSLCPLCHCLFSPGSSCSHVVNKGPGKGGATTSTL